MAGVVATELKQKRPFASSEQEVFLGLLITAARVLEPWDKSLKANAALTNNQYNVLRILRGSHPTPLACSDIAGRMVSRDPDITRLVDRLAGWAWSRALAADRTAASSRWDSPPRDGNCCGNGRTRATHAESDDRPSWRGQAQATGTTARTRHLRARDLSVKDGGKRADLEGEIVVSTIVV